MNFIKDFPQRFEGFFFACFKFSRFIVYLKNRSGYDLF